MDSRYRRDTQEWPTSGSSDSEKSSGDLSYAYFTGIRGGDVTGTIHEMNSKRQGLLLLMVRSRLVKKLRLGFLG